MLYSPMQANRTAMSIAQQLGYVSIVDILTPITSPSLRPGKSTDDIYQILSPEQMQDSYLYDSDEDVGELTLDLKLFLPIFSSNDVKDSQIFILLNLTAWKWIRLSKVQLTVIHVKMCSYC